MPTHSDKYSFQTIGIEQMKAHYLFTDEDVKILGSLLPIAKNSLEEMLKAFYAFIFNFEHARIFLNTEEIKHHHQQGITEWYLKLFSSRYDKSYFERLGEISEIHVKIGLPSHYVNAAFSFMRQFLEKLLIETGNAHALASLHKIIDINLDILSLTYKQESQEKLLTNILVLKRVIEHKGIIPFVQPIFDMKSGEISHYECLMRLQDEQNSTVCSILPMMQLAKQIMVYDDLVKQMTEKVFETFRQIPYPFTFNLGYEDIANNTFKNLLFKELQNLPNPSRVVFEILESDMISDFKVVANFIEITKVFGCKIAIDDFGAGYSNMENILKLKPDYIKIDGSLIRNIDHSEQSKKLVENIINIAHDIHARTIAEYVYNKKVYDTLQHLNINYLQGFYLAKPFPLSDLSASYGTVNT